MERRPHKFKLITVQILTGITVFVISFLWFCFPGEYVLIANGDNTLFLKTFGYLGSYLDRPGGLLDYLGSFLSQFFRFRLAGALLLAGMITCSYYLTGVLLARISGKKEFIIPGFLAAMLFLGMHNFYPHQVSHSLGFILVLFLAAYGPRDQFRRRVFLLLGVPLVYLVSGGYVWIFCGLVLLEVGIAKRKIDVLSVLLAILYPAMLILGAARFIFLDPLKELMGMHLPFGERYGASPWPYLLIGWLVLFILLAGIRKPWQKLKPLWQWISVITIALLGTILILYFSYNRKNAEFFHIEKLAIQEDWEALLHYTGQHSSMNLFGSFYTNLALVNSGSLCTDLFEYPQSFGRRGLCFEWEAKGEILRRGSDFFWTIHFVNEAHHWAFESMVIDGMTQRNLQRLIQTELVRENYSLAEKYIHLLGRSLFHKKMAAHYRHFLFNRSAIENDPELGPGLTGSMKHDFFSEGLDLEKNLRLLLANHPSNRPAYDYLMAILLLEKEVDKIASLLPGYLEAHAGKMPALLDESLLVYKITHQEDKLSNLRVSESTIKRFDAYTGILRQYRDPGDAARMLYPLYQNSFWFYLNFSSLTDGQP